MLIGRTLVFVGTLFGFKRHHLKESIKEIRDKLTQSCLITILTRCIDDETNASTYSKTNFIRTPFFVVVAKPLIESYTSVIMLKVP